MSDRSTGIMAHLGLGIALSLGLVGSTIYIGKTVEKIKSVDRSIEVKGYAERKIISDAALWSGTLVVRGKDLAILYQRLDKDRKRVFEFLEGEDLKADSINLSPVHKETLYGLSEEGQRTNDIDGYVLRQIFSLKANDVQKILTVATRIDQLNMDGLEFESTNPHYYFSSEKMDRVKIELLGEATKSAKERAEQFATVSGSSVGRLISARQGIFQVTPEYSTDLSDMGTYDTSTIEKVVKIVVTLSYETH